MDEPEQPSASGAPSDAARPHVRIGELLVRHRALTEGQLKAALAQPIEGLRLGSALILRGLATERAVAQALATQAGHPAAVLGESHIDLGALELVPRVIAERNAILPIEVDQETLTIAVADLTGPAGRRGILDQLELATGRRVRMLLVVESVLRARIRDAYDAQRAGEPVLEPSTHHPSSGLPGTGVVIVRRHSALPPDVDGLVAPDAPTPRSTAPIIPDEARPVVLIVDDDDDIRALLRRMLAHDGYEIREAVNGREALEMLRGEMPSLVLLDAMLPEVHGFDICASIKQSPIFAAVPVVMVSAVYKGWESAKQIHEVHKADAFVQKPFDVHYLRQLIARFVGRKLPRPALSPDWRRKIEALFTQANAAYHEARYDDAEEAVRRWRALDPFDAAASVLLGNIKSRRGDVEQAMHAYERAATFDPEFFAAWKNLALTCEQLGFQTRARQSWIKAQALAPNEGTRQRIQQRLAASSSTT